MESKRATVPDKHDIIIPRDLPDVLFGFLCVALFLGAPWVIALMLRTGAF